MRCADVGDELFIGERLKLVVRSLSERFWAQMCELVGGVRRNLTLMPGSSRARPSARRNLASRQVGGGRRDQPHVAGTPLFINRDLELDFLQAHPFGSVSDGQPPDRYRVVGEHFRFMLDRPRGRPTGFEVSPLSEFDPYDAAHARIWRPPRFDAPTLGLAKATAGEVVLAAQASLLEEPTANRIYFSLALAEGDSEEAVGLWRMCLECGDQMAHYGLGYTLHGLGRQREAYRHLRFYAELVPENAWAWCWLGRACEALGEEAEARGAYERAVELEETGGFETDAPELLAALTAPGGEPS